MRYRVPSRGVWILRHHVNDAVWYEAWWGVYDLCNHVLVTREPDRCVVACVEVDRVKYQQASYEAWGDAVMAYVKRVAERDQAVIGTPTKEGLAFGERYPAIIEYLTLEQFEDGAHRETSTMTVFVEAGVWKVCLNDRATKHTLWVSGASLVDALKALEAILRAGDGDWRAQKAWQPKKGGKRS